MSAGHALNEPGKKEIGRLLSLPEEMVGSYSVEQVAIYIHTHTHTYTLPEEMVGSYSVEQVADWLAVTKCHDQAL